MALTDMSKGMRVLVTGATGFVGRPICDALSVKGLFVRAAVRAPDLDLPHHVEQVLISSIGRDTCWQQALDSIDIVIHLAARVHVMQDTAQDPLAAFCEVNELGTANLGRQAAEHGVKRFVYVSSIKVNGEKTIGSAAFSELDEAAPEDAYGVSKWRAERALRVIEQESGMPVTVVRPPLIYGPGVKANFSRLLSVVAKHVPLPLGAVQNRRSLVYLGNLVDAIFACAIHPVAAGKTYLVSDMEQLSTPELIHRIANALDTKALLFPVPIRMLKLLARSLGRSAIIDRLTDSLLVDGSKFKTDTGWVPPYSLDQGLKDTAAWYLAQKRNEK